MNNMKTVKYTFLGKEHLHVQISVVVVVFFTQELTIPYLDPAFPYFLLIAETQKRKEKCYKEWKEGVMEWILGQTNNSDMPFSQFPS